MLPLMKYQVSDCFVKKIALVSGCLKLGGSTTFLLNLGGELVRRGWCVEVFSLEKDNPLADDFVSQNLTVVCSDHHKLIFEDRISEVVRRLAAFHPNYVVATLAPSAFEVLRYLPPQVVALGMGQSDDPQVYRLLNLYNTFYQACVVVSRHMLAQLKLPKPTHYIPYGIPVPAYTKRASDGGPLRILYLGRLERPQKRVQLFPQVLEALRSSGIASHWTIAGDGPEMEWLKARMDSRPGSTVSFIGKVDYKNVPSLLREQDIYVLTSDFEGLPLSLLEAMASGLVPVVSDLPSGIPEVVTDNTGALVDPYNVQGYADAIIRLGRKRDELHKKSAAARRVVEKDFSVVKMADRWIELLDQFSPQSTSWPRNPVVLPPITNSGSLHFSKYLRPLRRLMRGLIRSSA